MRLEKFAIVFRQSTPTCLQNILKVLPYVKFRAPRFQGSIQIPPNKLEDARTDYFRLKNDYEYDSNLKFTISSFSVNEVNSALCSISLISPSEGTSSSPQMRTYFFMNACENVSKRQSKSAKSFNHQSSCSWYKLSGASFLLPLKKLKYSQNCNI